MCVHDASALAQEASIRIPTWNDPGPLRCSARDEPSDISRWEKLGVLTLHESKETYL